MPPTMTGFPRSDGLSRCPTEAKKASRSTCRIVASALTGAIVARETDTATTKRPQGPTRAGCPQSGAKLLADVGADRDARRMSTTTFTIRTPLDFVAMAPLLLGFEPTESGMIETFGGFAGPFHARTDLVADPGHEFEVAGMLVDAALRNGVQQVAILVYSDHPERADMQARACETAFEREAIEVIEVLRITGDRFHRICGESGDPEGAQYDLSAHRFTTQGAARGRVVPGSRPAPPATLDPGDPGLRREI